MDRIAFNTNLLHFVHDFLEACTMERIGAVSQHHVHRNRQINAILNVKYEVNTHQNFRVNQNSDIINQQRTSILYFTNKHVNLLIIIIIIREMLYVPDLHAYKCA